MNPTYSPITAQIISVALMQSVVFQTITLKTAIVFCFISAIYVTI